MILHAFMIELDLLDYIDIQEKKKIMKNYEILCTNSMDNRYLVISQSSA